MELKPPKDDKGVLLRRLLIVLYGIETRNQTTMPNRIIQLLIVLYGIETMVDVSMGYRDQLF